jgi:hypothetical protein
MGLSAEMSRLAEDEPQGLRGLTGTEVELILPDAPAGWRGEQHEIAVDRADRPLFSLVQSV